MLFFFSPRYQRLYVHFFCLCVFGNNDNNKKNRYQSKGVAWINAVMGGEETAPFLCLLKGAFFSTSFLLLSSSFFFFVHVCPNAGLTQLKRGFDFMERRVNESCVKSGYVVRFDFAFFLLFRLFFFLVFVGGGRIFFFFRAK